MDTIDEALNKAWVKAGPNAYFGNGFHAGVAFADTFISIVEEYPPANIDVLLQQSTGRIFRGCYDKVKFWEMDGFATSETRSSSYKEVDYIVSWRPINYK